MKSTARGRLERPPRKMREVQPLSDDEFHFVWRGLADEGRLSVQKLQTFMQEVCGYKLSTVEAKDLLEYMDANGDGRVGMEDFRNFMSISCLAHTDSKNFMWTPKAKFREEQHDQHHEEVTHGSVSLPLSAADPVVDVARDVGSSNSTAAVRDASRVAPTPPKERPLNTRGGRRPGQARAVPQTPSPVPELELPNESSSSTAAAKALESEKEKEKRTVTPRVDAKMLAKIEHAISNYERNSWDEFVAFESEFKRKLFEQFAGENSDHLTPQEYHKMLTKWFPLAKWGAPGTLRPADSLATLESALRARRTATSTESADDAGGDGGCITEMDYGLWLGIMEGKYPVD